MTLRLRFYPDPILKQVSADVAAPPAQEFLFEMYRLMKAKGGVGLSAIQVGDPRRIIVLDVGHGPEVYLNPKIVLPEGKKIDEVFGKRLPVKEGCLSLPGVFEQILRYPTWNVSYLDVNFQSRTVNTDGLRAHVLQHEFEHLDGHLFVDELRSARRSAILGTMMKLRKSGALR